MKIKIKIEAELDILVENYAKSKSDKAIINSEKRAIKEVLACELGFEKIKIKVEKKNYENQD